MKETLFYEPTSAFRLPFDLNHCSPYKGSHVVRIIPLQQNRWIMLDLSRNHDSFRGCCVFFSKTIVRGTMPRFVCLSFHHQDLRQEQHQHGKAGEDPIVWQPKALFRGFFKGCKQVATIIETDKDLLEHSLKEHTGWSDVLWMTIWGSLFCLKWFPRVQCKCLLSRKVFGHFSRLCYSHSPIVTTDLKKNRCSPHVHGVRLW